MNFNSAHYFSFNKQNNNFPKKKIILLGLFDKSGQVGLYSCHI